MIAMTLPFPTSANRYWRNSKRGVYVSKEAMQYRERVAEIITALILDGAWCPSSSMRLRMKMVLNAPTRRKYDIDNRIKVCIDALAHAGLIPDDEQVDSLTVDRGEYRKNNGSCSVVLSEIAG